MKRKLLLKMYKKPLFYFFILILTSCHDENKFNLNSNLNDFNEIIETVIKYDSLMILNNSKGNYAITEYLEKIKITNPEIQNKDSLILITPPNSLTIGNLFYLQQVDFKGFDKKDSLYLLSQNLNPDSLKISDKLLSKTKHLTRKQIDEEWEKGNYIKYFTFKIPFISKDKSKAYIESGYRCGGLCGNGRAYFLEKNNGKWKVVKKWVTWMS